MARNYRQFPRRREPPFGIMLVQNIFGQENNVAALQTNTLPLTSTVGDTLIAVVTAFKTGGADPAIAMSDSLGNTWALATTVRTTTNGARVYIFYSVIKSAGSSHTVTATANATAFISMDVFEYKGLANIPLDQSNGATGSSTAGATGNVTSTYSQSLFIAAGTVDNAAITFTAGNNFNKVDQVTTGQDLYSQTLIAGAQTTQGSFTWSATTPWATSIAVFKPASASVLTSNFIRRTNQPQRNNIRRRQQPIVNEGWLKTPNSAITLTPANDPSLWIQPKSQPIQRKSKKIEITGGAISDVTEAPYVSYYKQPVNQPQRNRIPKRQQPIVAEGWLNKAASTTTTSSATISGQIRIGLNPALSDGYAEPPNQPLNSKFYTKRRLQPPSAKLRPLVSVTNIATISGQIRISENPSNIPDSWLQQVNQPLKSMVQKRQQPFAYNKRFLVSVANSSTISGQIRISLNPSTKDGFIQQVNQPLSFKSYIKRRLQPPATKLRPLITSATSASITGQIRVSENPATIPDSWLQQVNQPLRSRVLKRQQPPASKFRPLVTTSSSATISGQIRVSENPGLIPDSWIQPENQPLKSRVPKRQQPFSINKRFLVTASNQATISGQIRVASNPALEPVWKALVNQPLRSRVLKRQQPFAVGDKRFLTTANTSANISGQIRIAENPATIPDSWIQPTNQFIKSRTPKRQQPFAYENRRFLITVANSATITGQIRISINPVTASDFVKAPNEPLSNKHYVKRRLYPPSAHLRPLITVSNQVTITGQIRISENPAQDPADWMSPVEQPLRARVLKRQQPFAYGNKRFLTTANTSANISGQIRVSENPATNPESWIQPKSQLPKNRVPKRQQPFSYESRRFLVTTYGTTATISGQIRISANPALKPNWKHLTEQPLKSRVPKRQMPFAYGDRRFLISTNASATISGQIRISTNPAVNSTWKQSVNQYLRKRIPKRFQPVRVPIVVINVSRSATISGQIRIIVTPITKGSDISLRGDPRDVYLYGEPSYVTPIEEPIGVSLEAEAGTVQLSNQENLTILN